MLWISLKTKHIEQTTNNVLQIQNNGILIGLFKGVYTLLLTLALLLENSNLKKGCG